jgi:hypothetical protein
VQQQRQTEADNAKRIMEWLDGNVTEQIAEILRNPEKDQDVD